MREDLLIQRLRKAIRKWVGQGGGCWTAEGYSCRFPLASSAPSLRWGDWSRAVSSWMLGYLLRDLALLLVPRATIFLTHPTVMLDSHSGATQITFEWYLPHLSRSRKASV